MHRVKYETSTTGGATALTLSAATGFDSMFTNADHPFHPHDHTGACFYYLIDGNGTAWECGYGTISGSTLTRPSNDVFYSTDGAGGPGFYTSISLSGSTPHTVIITRGAFEGRVITARYSSTTGNFSTASQQFTSWLNEFDGLIYALDSKNGNSTANVVGKPFEEMKMARGYRLVAYGKCDNTSAGDMWGIGIRLNTTLPDIVQNYAPCAGSNTVCSVCTPMMRNVPPFVDSSVSHCLNDNNVLDYYAYNPNTVTDLNVQINLFIEWYL